MTLKKLLLGLVLAAYLSTGAQPARAAAQQLFSNNAVTTLASGAGSGATTLVVSSSAAFPALSGGNWFIATLEHIVSGIVTVNEIVKVTAVSGTNWTVVRAQEGTSAVAWLAGDTVALLPTAGGLAQFLQPGSSPTVTGNWTFSSTINGNAATATNATLATNANSLSLTPSQCTSSQFATGITAAGNANCATTLGGNPVTTSLSGSAVVSMQGFASSPIPIIIYYAIVGNVCTLYFPVNGSTSNNNYFTMTGLPSLAIPAHSAYVAVPDGTVINNSSVVLVSGGNAATLLVDTGGTLTFYLNGPGTLHWTASNIKGVQQAFAVSYLLN
jgi:hypothetical protein